MKTILVPTDFSECANNALEVAASIAKKTGASITLLHVLDVPSITVNGVGSMPETDEAPFMMKFLKVTKEKMKKIISSSSLKNISVSDKIEIGSANAKIIQAAEKINADLIVMGSHGCSGWKEIMMGSNTEKIVRLSTIPVFVIKKKIENFELRNIVFASNFDEHAEQAFIRITKLFNLFNSTIHLLKVNTRNHFETTMKSMKQMRKFSRKFLIQDATFNTYNDNSIEEGIRHFSNLIGADLIAMETHGRTGFAHIVNGSIAENVANHTSIPLLSVKVTNKIETKNYQKKINLKNDLGKVR